MPTNSAVLGGGASWEREPEHPENDVPGGGKSPLGVSNMELTEESFSIGLIFPWGLYSH